MKWLVNVHRVFLYCVCGAIFVTPMVEDQVVDDKVGDVSWSEDPYPYGLAEGGGNDTPRTSHENSEVDVRSRDVSDNGSIKSVGPAQGLAVVAVPLPESDHELSFNVSWTPPIGDPPIDYSMEVHSTTFTSDCNTPMCYEYNIPGNVQWWMMPARPNPYAGACAVKPGCSYRVRLIAHPWDGHTSANVDVSLNECVADVCSCGHAPRLPAPLVEARVVSLRGELHVNVTWRLPQPREPHRLPPALQKHSYYVSLGKQMVSDAHPAPWFAHTINRSVDTGGAVADGDSAHTFLLPLVERSEQRKVTNKLMLDVKLLARVILVDERGCLGPAGNATAYDPTEVSKVEFKTYVLWAIFGGACVLALVAVFAVGARGVKRVLNALRPAPVSAPLEPLHRRPAWLPLQLRHLPVLRK